MNIVEYFDPFKKEHMMAYNWLVEKGVWPMGFLPEDIEIPSTWQLEITHKLAAAWIVHMNATFTVDEMNNIEDSK